MTQEFTQLLEAFGRLPKRNTDPTFMEICRMGGDRFEERCSQILSFFLKPNGPHGLRGLMLESLLEAAGEGACDFSLRNVEARTEEMTREGKKIDITVVGEEFVIAIENKIDAPLYNPLECYRTHVLESYPGLRPIFVVLSGRRISDSVERELMRRHGYRYVNYSDLFDTLKGKLGAYATEANTSYLIFLFDFIRTIENRYNTKNMELKRFFYDNRAAIRRLIAEYNAFEDNILRLRKERISELCNLIRERTGASWWVYQGWDLGIKFNEEGNCLGIESCFRDGTMENPLGDFRIYVTVWKRSHFAPYREELEAAFPEGHIDFNPAELPSRIYLHIPAVAGGDTVGIVNKLEEVYGIVKTIADRHLE